MDVLLTCVGWEARTDQGIDALKYFLCVPLVTRWGVGGGGGEESSMIGDVTHVTHMFIYVCGGNQIWKKIRSAESKNNILLLICS